MAMRYKLRMFGVPIDGPAQVYCDNQGVVKNTSIPESVLSKKHNAINYHAVREAAAAGVLQVHKEDTATNLSDFVNKCYTLRDAKSCFNLSCSISDALGFRPACLVQVPPARAQSRGLF
jgi:hypothetical protein